MPNFRRASFRAVLLSAAGFLLPAVAVHASPILYTVSMPGIEARVNNSAVPGDPSFSFRSDTTDIVSVSGGYEILVSGGTLTVGSNTYALDGQQEILVTGSSFEFDLDNGSESYETDTSQFSGYNLSTNFSRTIDMDNFTQNGSTTFNGGADTFNISINGSPQLAFDAQLITPEPSSLTLLGTGCVGVVTMLRRRRARA